MITDGSNSILKPQLPMVGESPSCIKILKSDQCASKCDDMAIHLPKNSVTDDIGLKTASEIAHSLHSGSNGKERLDSVECNLPRLIKYADTSKNSENAILENTTSDIREISKSDYTLTDFELFCQNDTAENAVSKDVANNEIYDNGKALKMIKDHDTSITDEILLAVAEDAIWDESVSDDMLIKCTQEFPRTPTEGCTIENGDSNLHRLSGDSISRSSLKEDTKKVGNSSDTDTNNLLSGLAITLCNNHSGNDLELITEDEELLLALTS